MGFLSRRKERKELSKLAKAATLLRECSYYNIESEDLIYSLRYLLERIDELKKPMQRYLDGKLTDLGEK